MAGFVNKMLNVLGIEQNEDYDPDEEYIEEEE